MCARTKISYGCGCIHKETNECYSSRCDGIQRFQIWKEGDCKACKSGGANVTRGREGKGRYGQLIHKRSDSSQRERQSKRDAVSTRSGQIQVESQASSPTKDDLNGAVSPWRAQGHGEKEWDTPSRQRADSAWHEEHEERMADLERCFNGLRASTPPSATSPPRCRSPTYIITDQDHDHFYNIEYRSPAPSKGSSRIRTSLSPETTHRQRPTQHTRRHHSHDNIEYAQPTCHDVRKGDSKHHKPRHHGRRSHDTYEIMSHPTYGSYDSHDAPVYGTRTEPYLPTCPVLYNYSTAPQGYQMYFQPAYTVDVISRAPELRYQRTW